MTSLTGILAAVGLLVGIAVLGVVVRRWWLDRARTDPSRDPLASRVAADRKLALDHILEQATDPGDAVDRGLALCAVDDLFSWRAGLRRLMPLVERLADDADGQALRAEVALQLGEIEVARGLVGSAPADHWRVCGVRAALYELDGDVERAESAWVASMLLAPTHQRARPSVRLEGLRRRHRRRTTPTQDLWERGP